LYSNFGIVDDQYNAVLIESVPRKQQVKTAVLPDSDVSPKEEAVVDVFSSSAEDVELAELLRKSKDEEEERLNLLAIQNLLENEDKINIEEYFSRLTNQPKLNGSCIDQPVDLKAAKKAHNNEISSLVELNSQAVLTYIKEEKQKQEKLIKSQSECTLK
jgi:carboxylesterase type B